MQHKYKVSDKYIIYHQGDPGLDDIKVMLPEPPPFEDTVGYGLAPEEQYWGKYQQLNPVPNKLKKLRSQKTTDYEKRKEIIENEVYYHNEIKWIQQEWSRMEKSWIDPDGVKQSGKGVWIFIKGKQYWIPPEFYFYLREWSTGDINPRFYMRDWRYWIFSNFTDADIDCYGYNYVKFRREGATTKVSCWRYWRTMQGRNQEAGCQSKNEDHAKKIHTLFMMKPWKKLSFWVRPIWDGDTKNTSEINFTSPLAKGDPWFSAEALESTINYKPADVFAYDGQPQHSFHNDEVGKMPSIDVNERWQVQKPCAEDGSDIIGKFRNTSTVAEMDKKGGRAFKKLCDASHYGARDENNRTESGVYNLFIPATDGFSMKEAQVKRILLQLGRNPAEACNYPDKYGECDEEVTMRFIMNKRQAKLNAGNIAGFVEECRQFPLNWNDCWKESSRSQNFNMLKLEMRISELDDNKLYNTFVRRGNFKWEDNIPDTRVIWEDSDEGKFFVSYLFDKPEASNKYYMRDGMRCPGNVTKFQAGADPFAFKETLTNKKSDGAGAVFMKRDGSIDHLNLDVSEWRTHRFCCTYSNRPKTKKEYGEDMIMMCVYYGCEVYPEVNVDLIWDYFDERGYFAYLTFGTDRKTGKLLKTPGGHTKGGNSNQEIFEEYQTYIENHCHREVHREILKQCKVIDYDMGDYDLFAAGGYALVGIKKNAFQAMEERVKEWEPSYYNIRTYNN